MGIKLKFAISCPLTEECGGRWERGSILGLECGVRMIVFVWFCTVWTTFNFFKRGFGGGGGNRIRIIILRTHIPCCNRQLVHQYRWKRHCTRVPIVGCVEFQDVLHTAYNSQPIGSLLLIVQKYINNHRLSGYVWKFNRNHRWLANDFEGFGG